MSNVYYQIQMLEDKTWADVGDVFCNRKDALSNAKLRHETFEYVYRVIRIEQIETFGDVPEGTKHSSIKWTEIDSF